MLAEPLRSQEVGERREGQYLAGIQLNGASSSRIDCVHLAVDL